VLRLVLFAMIILFIASCQKKIDPQLPIVNKNILLINSVTRLQTDSLAFSYQYNTSKQLIGENYIQSWEGVKDTAQTNIVRNSQGIIQETSYISVGLRKQGFESFTYKVIYDDAKSNYVRKIAHYTLRGSMYSDSVVYTCNDAHQIIIEEKFSTSGSPTGTYAPVGKKEYSYDNNGNLIEQQTYSNKNASGTYKLTLTNKYVYDSKQAPLTLGGDAIVIEDLQYVSKNNPVQTSYIDDVTPANSYDFTNVYSWNSDNFPSSATSNYGNVALVTTYSYKIP
jgi:hypothetical protein